MPRKRAFQGVSLEEIKAAVRAARDRDEHRRALAVWLRVAEGLTTRRIARLLAWDAGAVSGVHGRFRRRGVNAFVDRRRAPASPEAAAGLRSALREARTVAEFRRVLCVWLRLGLGLGQRQVRQALACSQPYVAKVQAAYRKHGAGALRRAAAAAAPEWKGDLRAAVRSARTATGLRLALCLWMRAGLKLETRVVSQALLWDPSAVCRALRDYQRRGAAAAWGTGRGGRRRGPLTREQEYDLLRAVRLRGAPGWPRGFIPLDLVREEAERRAGRPLKSSELWALLDRHGWNRAALLVTPRQADRGVAF